MRDTSLDEFLDGDDGEVDEGADGELPDDDGEGDDGAEVDDDVGVEPVESDDGSSGDDAEPAADDDEDGADTGNATTEDEPVDPDSVEPAVATASWSPDGGTCEACGSVVERRWRSDDGQVCGDCKEW